MQPVAWNDHRTRPFWYINPELGWKPVRQLLYEKQIKFYFRIFFLNEQRWVNQALRDHMSGAWLSPYLSNICAIRARLGIFDASPNYDDWKPLSQKHFIESINSNLLTLPHIQPLVSLQRLPYVCESKWSTVISELRLGCEGLGNKKPRSGYNRKPFCPVCQLNLPNSGQHLLFSCSSLSALRSNTGISSFMTACLLRGFTVDECYSMFVSGLDSKKKTIDRSSHLERARCMHDMRELWLSKWWWAFWRKCGILIFFASCLTFFRYFLWLFVFQCRLITWIYELYRYYIVSLGNAILKLYNNLLRQVALVLLVICAWHK